MTANKELMYWHSNKKWYFINKKTKQFELTDKAPERAIKSFEKWKNQKDEK